MITKTYPISSYSRSIQLAFCLQFIWVIILLSQLKQQISFSGQVNTLKLWLHSVTKNHTVMHSKISPSDCLHSNFAESQGFLDVRLSTVKIAVKINKWRSIPHHQNSWLRHIVFTHLYTYTGWNRSFIEFVLLTNRISHKNVLDKQEIQLA